MPSVSDKQQTFMRMVLAYKHGKLKDASPEIKKAAESMDEDTVHDFADKKAAQFMTANGPLMAGIRWLCLKK